MNLEIEHIKKIIVNPNEVIWVSIPRKNMPPHKFKEYLNEVKNAIHGVLPDGVKLLVTESEIDISVINKEELKINL